MLSHSIYIWTKNGLSTIATLQNVKKLLNLNQFTSCWPSISNTANTNLSEAFDSHAFPKVSVPFTAVVISWQSYVCSRDYCECQLNSYICNRSNNWTLDWKLVWKGDGNDIPLNILYTKITPYIQDNWQWIYEACGFGIQALGSINLVETRHPRHTRNKTIKNALI